jgi:hypothetical protein
MGMGAASLPHCVQTLTDYLPMSVAMVGTSRRIVARSIAGADIWPVAGMAAGIG